MGTYLGILIGLACLAAAARVALRVAAKSAETVRAIRGDDGEGE